MTPNLPIAWRDEDVRGFGMSVGGRARVLRPTTSEQIADAFADARARGGSIALRGAGCSYGDAATNTNGHVLDLSNMNRVLSFDPATGVAVVEPGATVRDLWQRAIVHAYWPRVVSGTMAV
jgi:FAD/FMN-containing dehydrogenase